MTGTHSSKYIPRRGDLVWLNFTPAAGHEHSGHHSALILSEKDFNRITGFAMVCPITSQVKGYPFEVVIPPGLKIGGVILVDQTKSIDWRERKVEFAAELPQEVLFEVYGKLLAIYGLEI